MTKKCNCKTIDALYCNGNCEISSQYQDLEEEAHNWVLTQNDIEVNSSIHHEELVTAYLAGAKRDK